MHVFDQNCKIKKMSCPEEIIYTFYKIRKELYVTRKKAILSKMEHELSILSSKIFFITLIIEHRLVINNVPKNIIESELEKYPDDIVQVDGSWDYLLDMKLYSLTKERLEKLNNEKNKLTNERNVYSAKTIKQIWNEELDLIA